MAKYIVKFPLLFTSAGSVAVGDGPKEQFPVFINTPPNRRLMQRDYGLDIEYLAQTAISGIQTSIQTYLVSLRDKMISFLKNIRISRSKAEFDRSTRTVTITVYYYYQNSETGISWNVVSM